MTIAVKYYNVRILQSKDLSSLATFPWSICDNSHHYCMPFILNDLDQFFKKYKQLLCCFLLGRCIMHFHSLDLQVWNKYGYLNALCSQPQTCLFTVIMNAIRWWWFMLVQLSACIVALQPLADSLASAWYILRAARINHFVRTFRNGFFAAGKNSSVNSSHAGLSTQDNAKPADAVMHARWVSKRLWWAGVHRLSAMLRHDKVCHNPNWEWVWQP